MKLLTITSVLIVGIIITVLIIRFSSQVINEADDLDNQPD
jgi:uncharacterized membrane-anchored protein YhcB (DUF1043 family)